MRRQPAGGLACALEAALVSPNFLFRTELLAPRPPLPGCASQTPLAASVTWPLRAGGAAVVFPVVERPRQELLELAASGRLAEDAVIEAQVNRMLAPGGPAPIPAGRLSRGLPTQWLQLDSMATAEPSPAVYPGVRRGAAAGDGWPSRGCSSTEILQQNRSALELVRAPFTFVNQRLAAHYGLPPVAGEPQCAGWTPPGLCAAACWARPSFHTITSSSENTSIVLRARWVLQNLLCTPLGDPPPGAQEMVPAPDPALGLTRRQSLEQRTAIYPCTACHDILNPVGFGLEIFDGIGAQRCKRSRSADRRQRGAAVGPEVPGHRNSCWRCCRPIRGFRSV